MDYLQYDDISCFYSSDSNDDHTAAFSMYDHGYSDDHHMAEFFLFGKKEKEKKKGWVLPTLIGLGTLGALGAGGWYFRKPLINTFGKLFGNKPAPNAASTNKGANPVGQGGGQGVNPVSPSDGQGANPVSQGGGQKVDPVSQGSGQRVDPVGQGDAKQSGQAIDTPAEGANNSVSPQAEVSSNMSSSRAEIKQEASIVPYLRGGAIARYGDPYSRGGTIVRYGDPYSRGGAIVRYGDDTAPYSRGGAVVPYFRGSSAIMPYPRGSSAIVPIWDILARYGNGGAARGLP